ncbi:MAG TPA: glycosyltransferase family 2 protein [Spirochaetota bacterium]|nr:glycosyltransferase family 2 protein [Spirochaetota bacterium]HRZ26087.1 glycosyltransferase family 2 protein [Spirochaetota bacterium]
MNKHKKSDLITIITVVKNDEANIERTIKSVLSQTYPFIQYIIIDGSSNDGTLNVIEKYSPHIDLIISEHDEGIYDAMNKGVNNATGEWVFFLNSGDEFHDEHVLSKLSRYFPGNISLIFGDVIVIESDGKRVIQKHKKMSRHFLLKKTICHQSILFKKELFSQIGLFNTDYNIKADYDWLLRYYFKNKKNSLYINLEVTRFLKGGFSDDANKDRIEKMRLVKEYFTSWEYLFMFILNSRALLLKNSAYFHKSSKPVAP